uniref:Phosphoinositide-3-kinase adaptor protein 1 n=1 Tax=Stegastes partitus TaxID=144197 RepID=A0A3B4Z007_9TELE
LQQILQSSQEFHTRPILLYAVGPADEIHGYNFESFQSCECIVLLLTGAFLDNLCDHELQEALQRLLYPPHRVVALLCGISEDSALEEHFIDWATENPTADETEEVVSEEQKEAVLEDEEPASTGNSTGEEMSSPTHLTCLTVQPNRVLCGGQETLYIILTHKIDDQVVPEVEFSSENVPAKRVSGTMENEYTISVIAPDMPAGNISLTLHTDQSCVSLKPVTYYTKMGEVSRYLENVTDPVDFICQAFNLTTNTTESLDNMLTDSIKSRMPAAGLQLFGIVQIEEDNMSAYQRDEELPTLLHFAAKYGLKKLTTILLQCPGALQAYSVMNKHGDYPNKLAEKSGFSDLRQFMDDFVETADMLKSHFEETINTDDGADVYEMMSATSQDIMKKYSGCPEDIYMSMVEIDPGCVEDLCKRNTVLFIGSNIDIYDTVDADSTYNAAFLNRPPAPIPRPESESDSERPVTYISRAQPVVEAPTPTYDPYAGMKTPGQRQLISLQERVKVGEITVDEAVQEFKAWQFDHERRANSIRYQQDNLKKLRNSITRRHKERQKTGKELDYEISAPLQRNLYWGSNMTLECAVYEPAPRVAALPPTPVQVIQRGNWKTGSTSSTSSKSLLCFVSLHVFLRSSMAPWSQLLPQKMTKQENQSASSQLFPHLFVWRSSHFRLNICQKLQTSNMCMSLFTVLYLLAV